MNTNIGIGIERADGSVICAACEHEAEWFECSACGGDGGADGYEEDPLWYQPGEIATCPQCAGGGGEYGCVNPDCKTAMILKIENAK